jgi:hypothetical protein
LFLLLAQARWLVNAQIENVPALVRDELRTHSSGNLGIHVDVSLSLYSTNRWLSEANCGSDRTDKDSSTVDARASSGHMSGPLLGSDS